MPLFRQIGRIGYAQPVDIYNPMCADGYDCRVIAEDGGPVTYYDPVIPVSYTPLPYLNDPAETNAPPPDSPGAPVDVPFRPRPYTTLEKPNILPVPGAAESAEVDWTILLSLGAVFFSALSGDAVAPGPGKTVVFAAGLAVLYYKLTKQTPAVPVMTAQ